MGARVDAPHAPTPLMLPSRQPAHPAGMRLGAPAVAMGADAPGGWLDQFMSGARARGLRVDFVPLHWYGWDWDAGRATQQLQAYIEVRGRQAACKRAPRVTHRLLQR